VATTIRGITEKAKELSEGADDIEGLRKRRERQRGPLRRW